MSKARRKSRDGPPSPDEGLAPDSFDELNRALYDTRPQRYLKRRHLYLVLTRSKGAEIDSMASDGLDVGRMHFTSTPDETSESDREKFAIAESEVLLSHVSETVIRLYLAHREIPQCPWLELARVRSPQKFKKRVEVLSRQLDEGSEDSHIRTVFYGNSDRKTFKPKIDEGDWERGTSNLRSYLQCFVEVVGDSNAYNAAKHGLALVAGSSTLRMEALGMDPLNLSDGPALECLVVTPQKDGKRKWARQAKWLDLDRCSAYSWMGCQMLDALWTVGKARYLGDLPNSIASFSTPSFEDVETFFSEQAGDFRTQSLTIPLVYYADNPN